MIRVCNVESPKSNCAKKEKKKQVKTNDGHSKEELQKKTVHPSEDVS